MGVIRYDITEEEFANNKLPLSELSILTGVDSSAYLVVNDDQKAVAVRAFAHDENEEWWTADERLKSSFRKIRLAWLSERFTIVPARLYDGDKRKNYLSGLTTINENDTVLADALPALDAFLVYALDAERLFDWRRSFIGCRFYHMLTPLLHQLAAHNKQHYVPKMYAYFKDNLLVVVGMEKGVLKFCNAFPCKEAKDFLYYLLLAYEQCKWNPSQVGLDLLGELLEDAAIYKLFYRYVKKMTFLEAPSFQQHHAALNWGKQSERTPKHVFFDIASLHLYH